MTTASPQAALALCTALLASACAPDDSEESGSASIGGSLEGGADSLHPQWLSDSWYHDDGRENYADYADYYIDLSADGSGHYWDDHWIFDFSGEWQLDGNQLTVGDYTMDIQWTPNCAVIEAEGKTFIGTLDRERLDCPTTPDELSPTERCLVGRWSTYSNDGVITNQSWWTFTEDRTYLETWDYSGYTSGGSAGAVEGFWRVTNTGDIEITYPNGSSEVRAAISDFAGRTRDTAVDPACAGDPFTPQAAGCAGGDPYECSGDDLRDCATNDIIDCDGACVEGGWSGASDPACGVGEDGYELCLCE